MNFWRLFVDWAGWTDLADGSMDDMEPIEDMSRLKWKY